MGDPNQGETFCQDSEAECPHCGLVMALDSEPVEVGEKFSCAHCDGKIVVSEVDYTIYVRLKADGHNDSHEGEAMRIVDENNPTEPLFEVNGKIGAEAKQVFVTAKDENEARSKAATENPGLVIETVYDITAAA